MIPRALIVILPGIGGTRLMASNGQVAYDGTPADFLSPSRLAALAELTELRPQGLLRDWRLCRFWTPIHGYEHLLESARRALGVAPEDVDDGAGRPNLDATVVGFGYDFRLGVQHASASLERTLASRIANLWPRRVEQRARVILVGHSMGGLVARHWVATSALASTVRAVVTLGTPHRGAPKALDVMANGYPVQLPGVQKTHVPWVSPIARSWPGMSDLLPQYPVVPQGARQLRPPNLVRPVDSDLCWLARAAESGAATHRQIRDGWRRLDDPPEVVPRLGFGHVTLRAVRRKGDSLSVDTGPDPHLGTHGDYWANDLGDGTVPATSAVPVELGRHRPADFRVAARHGALVRMDMTDLLTSFGAAPPVPAVYMAEHRTYGLSIGLDLAEHVAAASPVNIAATVWQRRGQAVARRQENLPRELVARVVPEGNRAMVGEVSMSLAATGEFRGTIPPLAPGLYDVQVHPRHLPHEPVHQLIDVIDE